MNEGKLRRVQKEKGEDESGQIKQQARRKLLPSS
jgi:hypothetical protein